MSDVAKEAKAGGHDAMVEPQQVWLLTPYFVGVVLFALAAWFLFGSDLASIPDAATPKFNKARIVPGPLRQVILTTDPPLLHINEFDRTCMECHRTFKNPDPRIVKLEQHSHVELQHGINTHCYHCHDFEDRNMLVLRNADTVPYTRVADLCAQCHTRIHADWLNGIHGKRLGYWDDGLGEQKPIVCTGCHDPHWPSRPAMQGMKPLAGPNTLRMGEHSPHSEHPGDAEHIEADPLQRAVHSSKGH
ncbi:MAG: hypothetical protein KDC98_25020 [Planctomycetes bacterium]|nr:hypothetical protein [Planctomycetota bacterium]